MGVVIRKDSNVVPGSLISHLHHVFTAALLMCTNEDKTKVTGQGKTFQNILSLLVHSGKAYLNENSTIQEPTSSQDELNSKMNFKKEIAGKIVIVLQSSFDQELFRKKMFSLQTWKYDWEFQMAPKI